MLMMAREAWGQWLLSLARSHTQPRLLSVAFKFEDYHGHHSEGGGYGRAEHLAAWYVYSVSRSKSIVPIPPIDLYERQYPVRDAFLPELEKHRTEIESVKSRTFKYGATDRHMVC